MMLRHAEPTETLMKFLSTLLFTAIGMGLAAPMALAQGTPAATRPATSTSQASKKAPAKKPSRSKKAAAGAAAGAAGAAAGAEVHDDDKEPDVATSAATDYNCELGNKLTIYRNADDNKHIALRWKKQLLRLNRVETTTGANRFENRRNGLVWIDIPTKGMLLDSKKGQQLANECMSPEQMQRPPETTKS
jgi:membrane-bound inhibitor of C-type lysozyme